MENLFSLFLPYLPLSTAAGFSISACALMMARLLAVVNQVPFLGAQNAPGALKVGFAFLLSFLLWPTAAGAMSSPLPDSTLAFCMLLLKELFIGTILGFVTAQVFYMVEMSGRLIDIFRGAQQIELLVPGLAERSSAFGSLQYQLMIILFLAADLHVIFFQGIAESFVFAPIQCWPSFSAGWGALFERLIQVSGDFFATAVTLAAPMGIVALMVDITFGLINRIAPQMNAYILSLPAKALACVLVFLVSFSLILEHYPHEAHEGMRSLFEVLHLFR